jgi:hypothetical protein
MRVSLVLDFSIKKGVVFTLCFLASLIESKKGRVFFFFYRPFFILNELVPSVFFPSVT